MNPKKHYDKLIDRARNRTLNKYTETHHIITRCMDGTDDEYLYNMYLLYVILIQNWLTQNNIPFLMMDAFGNHEDPLRFAPQFKPLFDQVSATTFIGWPSESMVEWTNGVEYGVGGHFLTEGHQIVADIIYDNLKLLYPNIINI